MEDQVLVSSLGDKKDGGAELIDGLGMRAPEVLQLFLNMLKDRQMPDAVVETIGLQESGLKYGTLEEQYRDYVLLTIPACSATVAVHIGAKGKDLLMAWTLLVKPRLNWLVIGILGAIAFVLALISERMMTAISNPFGGGGFSFGGFLFAFVMMSVILGVVTVGLARNVTGKNPLLRDLTLFDLDDIRAVSIAAHRTLLQAADEAGIAVELLRVKQQFFGDFRERIM